MYWGQSKPQWKYLKIEVAFFVIVFLVFPILSTFEYNFIELHKVSIPTNDAVSSLFYGLSDIVTAFIFYKLIRHLLFNRRFMLFIASTVIYLVLFHFYKKGLYYLTGHSTFLPASLTKNALRWYKSRINFSTVYMCMQFLGITAMAYFIRSSKQDEQMHLLREQQLVSELNYLKAQIHPHFFFNTINNIYSLALKQSADTAPMVAKLGEMMRYILYETDQKIVPLTCEVEFLNNYISVEKIRHSQTNSILFDVQGVILDMQIEPLLLLPFIENAFKHGLEAETVQGHVNIVICIVEKELTLEVRNSKPLKIGNVVTQGNGLQNVIKRLDLLYPGNYQLEVKEDEHIYNVMLTLHTA